MPAQYNLPEYVGAYTSEDVDLYNKLPFYLAAMQVMRQSKWDTYNKLFGSIKWQANMGSTMKGVEAVHTPIGRQFFSPQPITGQPKKDVFTPLERTEQCNILMHDFDSNQIYFLPSFQDFRTNQVDFTHEDITRQMSVANEMFIRTVMLQKSPFVFIAGRQPVAGDLNLGMPELVGAPYIGAGVTVVDPSEGSAGKSTEWLKAAAAQVGAPGLSFPTVDRMYLCLRDDLGAPFFEGGANSPKDNELLKGKYVFVGSQEAYGMFKYDPWVRALRDINWNIAIDGFRGSPWDEITWKSERYPLRMTAAGTFPVPEIQDDNNDTVVNPEYAAAKYEWGFILGADAYKTIKIGPPPKPFAGKMSLDQFNGMNWNGEVQLTRDFLIQYLDADNNTVLDTNARGRYVKFISSLTMGCMATRSRNAIPVLYERARPAANLGAA